MLNKRLLTVTLTLALSGVIGLSYLSAYSYTTGSPDKCTGSPSDKATCAQSECHEGTAEFKAGLITSDIPATGFVPGKTYTITGRVTGGSNSKRFGFQISPQSPAGELLGKMIVTQKSETKLTGKGKYITQKDMGVDGNISKSWSFQWTAPATGPDAVTFYGCFLVGGRKELIYNSKLEVKKAG